MDNKKKTDSIMRYVVYLLCGVLLAGYSLLKWNAMSEMKYLYLAIGVIWVIYGGVRALVLARRQKQDRELAMGVPLAVRPVCIYPPSSHSTTPYTTLAAVPNTITGPAIRNILAAMPVIRPSACVKIGHIFFCFSRIIGFSPTVISYFFSKAYHPACLATAFMISSVKSS